jgi:hypothetical protein
MSIMVMPYLESDVYANGVALTRNPYREAMSGYLLNVQPGNHKVIINQLMILSLFTF